MYLLTKEKRPTGIFSVNRVSGLLFCLLKRYLCRNPKPKTMDTLRWTGMLTAAVLLLTGCGSSGNKPSSVSGTGIAVADSIRMLFVGTYTRKEDHVDGKAVGVYLYRLNLKTGKLTYAGEAPTVNPSYLAVDTAKRVLYTVNEVGSENGFTGTISSFRLTGNGKPEFINSVSSEGNYPCYVSVDQSGKWVLCANYGTGTLAVIPSAPDGRLGVPVSVIRHTGKGPDPRQMSAHAHMIVSSPDHRFFYSCDLGNDKIYIYGIDSTRGTLSETSQPYHSLPGSGPRHLDFHPSLPVAYVVNELSGTVEVMSVNATTGGLARLQSVSTLEGIEATAAACADIHLTPSGRFLYVSNRGTVNNLAVFSTDPANGLLTPTGHQELSGKTPRSFVIDPAGSCLLVAFQDTDNVSAFAIDANSGKLTLLSETIIPTPVCLKIAGEEVK